MDRPSLAPIDLAAMADLDDNDFALRAVDRIDNPMITLSDPIAFLR